METNENTEKVKASPRTSQKYESGSRKKKKNARIKAVILLLLLTAAVAGGLSYYAAYKRVQKEYAHMRQPIVIEESEVLDTLRGNLEAGTGVTSSLRKSFKDYLIINDGTRYIFNPVNYDLKMHRRTKEELDTTGAFWNYERKNRKLARPGVDVSSHQGPIDWAKVKEDGVEFAICRALYRGYGSGKLVVDE